MMNMLSATKNRQRLWICIAIAVLGVYACTSVLDAWDAESRLQRAQGELAEIEQKVQTIKNAKQKPQVAALDLESPDGIVNRINSALRAAGLPASTLKNQNSAEPTRIAKSEFAQRLVTINLQASRLIQIVKFCDALRDEETGSTVRDIVLSIPRGSGTGNQENWDAELVLTQMIFSPTNQ